MPKVNLIQFDDDDENLQNHQNNMLLNEEDIIEEKRQRQIKKSASNQNKQPNAPQGKPSKNSSNGKKFITAFLVSLIVCLTFIGGAFYAYDKFFVAGDKNINKFNSDNSKYAAVNAKDQYNFAIFAVDNESPVDPRTDFMIIGSYNTKTNKVSLMSIPRDTIVYMPQERIDYLKAHKVNTSLFPSSGKMLLSQVNHFATDEYGTSFLLAQMEEMFQVDFDFYAKFNVDGFKYLVTEIGGVPFDVPQRMYYNDPTQNLYVDLQPGYQILNGEQAEGLVRYRKSDEKNPISKGYARGDLQRIEVQQDFIIAFAKQLSSLQNLPTTLPAILTTATKYGETNFPISDLPIFLPVITNFSAENITMHTMPTEPSGANVTVKEPDTSELIDEIFFSTEEVTPVSSIGLNIIILNGTYTNGLATAAKEQLEANGFTVSSIGDSETKLDQTKIYVKDRAYGQDLKSFFNSPKIINDPNLDWDIKIILGQNQS